MARIQPPGKRRARWVRAGVWMVGVPWGTGLLAGWALGKMPLPRGLLEAVAPPAPTEWVDRDGATLRIQALEPGRIGRAFAEAELPRALIDATLAAEDARFYHHGGVDAWAVLRATGQMIRHRRIVSGASTITQQLIKQVQPRPRTFPAKLIEAVQAWRLEREWDKTRILNAYLSRIDYGDGCIGVAAAAHHYFGKAAADLDWAEAALLAGLPQGPSRLNPRHHFERAKRRQEWVLRRCRQLGGISEEALATALIEKLQIRPPAREFTAPHFIEFVRAQREVAHQLGRPERVPTTLDRRLQIRCEEIVHQQVSRLRNFQVQDAAVVVLDNRSGDLLAMVGSADWAEPTHGQVNGALARRSPGSALKPFTYLLAFAEGATAADVVADVPTEFATPTGVFRPLNYDRHFRGPVSLRQALANSLNVPAVRVLARHGGPERLQSLLQSAGLTTLDRRSEDYGLGLTLGSAEVRLLELANAYATLARQGEWLPVRFLALATAKPSVGRRVAPRDACWLVADILGDPQARAAAFGMETPLRFDFPVACKTGTSSGFRDNWAFGFTPEFTVGVWVGRFDGAPMHGVSGVVGAAPILHDIFEELHGRLGTSWFATPDRVEIAWVDPLTGHRIPPDSRARKEVFAGGQIPPESRTEDYDVHGRRRLSAEYAEWAGTADNRLGDAFVLGEESGTIRILSPLSGTVLLLDGDLPEASQRLKLRASSRCRWQCDTLKLVQSRDQIEVQLVPGHHRLIAIHEEGNTQAETWIEVRRR